MYERFLLAVRAGAAALLFLGFATGPAEAQVADCTGKPATMACTDDGNVCTRDLCDGSGNCIHPFEPLNFSCADDGNQCTRDVCDGSGACVHQNVPMNVTCNDDGNACTRDFCDGSGTCVHPFAASNTACADDGNECTRDVCDGFGACAHPNTGDLAPCSDDGNECTRDLCQGGNCLHPPTGDLAPCTDDGSSCTRDYCFAGVCEHPQLAANAACPDDGNPCTLDVCVAGVCEHTGDRTCQNDCAEDEDGTACTDDGNPCTFDVCAGGSCMHINHPGGSPCPGGNACTYAQCNGAGACLNQNVGFGADCDTDGNDCTYERCDGGGSCLHQNMGFGAACAADSNECTYDLCNGGGTCLALNHSFAAPCADDGLDCTFEVCSGGGVCMHQPLAGGAPCYDDGLDCTFDACSGASQCLHTPYGSTASCNDDVDDCTSDFCAGDTCFHGALSGCTTPPQTSDQARCLTGLNGGGVKLSAAQGKENSACVKNAAKGDEPAPQACLTLDAKGKVASAATKVTETFTSKCTALPDFGAQDAAPILASAGDERLAVVSDLFGETLDGVVTGSDEAIGKCQAAVHGAMEKLVTATLKSFVKCKKAGLEETIVSRLGLDDCLLDAGTAIADPASSLGKSLAKIGSSREKSCESVTMGAAFPGECGALANDPAFDVCAGAIARCRACRIIVAVDAPYVDCDTFDDGSANKTCPRD